MSPQETINRTAARDRGMLWFPFHFQKYSFLIEWAQTTTTTLSSIETISSPRGTAVRTCSGGKKQKFQTWHILLPTSSWTGKRPSSGNQMREARVGGESKKESDLYRENRNENNKMLNKKNRKETWCSFALVARGFGEEKIDKNPHLNKHNISHEYGWFGNWIESLLVISDRAVIKKWRNVQLSRGKEFSLW